MKRRTLLTLMAGNKRFNILIVDPDPGSRTTLRQVALSLPRFKDVSYCSSLDDALLKGTGPDSFDVATISYRFTQDEIAEFIPRIKATPKGRHWAFISVLKTANQKNEIIAQGMLSGIDGFLFEPYSADNLKEMAEVTARVKHQNEVSRRKAALEVYLKEVSSHLDAVAFYTSQGRDAVPARKRLTDACKNLEDFRKDNFETYIEVATEMLGRTSPPVAKRYQGVSKRVRARLQEKMLTQLRGKYEGD